MMIGEGSLARSEDWPAELWDVSISNHDLVFSEGETQANRPGGISTRPAALVRASSLAVHIVDMPVTNNTLTIGVARWPGFRTSGGHGFGEQTGSWGLCLHCGKQNGTRIVHSSKEQMDQLPRLQVDDVVRMECDRSSGRVNVKAARGEEVVFVCDLPLPDGEHVLGATLSNDAILAVIPAPVRVVTVIPSVSDADGAANITCFGMGGETLATISASQTAAASVIRAELARELGISPTRLRLVRADASLLKNDEIVYSCALEEAVESVDVPSPAPATASP